MKQIKSRIVSIGMTKLGKFNKSATELMNEALINSLTQDIWNPLPLKISDIDGLIAIPSLSEPHFMMAHYFATKYNLFNNRSSTNQLLFCKTIDLGGAGPISALIHADNLIKSGQCNVIAILAGDAIGSMKSSDFLAAADSSCMIHDSNLSDLNSPVIPNGYNKVAEWYMNKGKVSREQLGMVSVLMSINAVNHPYALTKKVRKLEEVLTSQKVSSHTGIFECAHRTDGAACLILASEDYLKENKYDFEYAPYVRHGCEASGPLFPPKEINENTYNSCILAINRLYKETNITIDDIDYFGLYDCFPICFIKAVEAIGLYKKHTLLTKDMKKDLTKYSNAGDWIEGIYNLSVRQGNFLHPFQFPVNTHGGLLCFGAPWEVPALFNVIEAVKQMRGIANKRQIPNVNRALIYGNGGILSASSIVLLENDGI